ncbi:threonine/serine exporter family protein [uncultured Corynebacterium sp.]|uniref:threonine/serine exporter family protein n=1 Tax=uncultured Corynebacterium sp. TaxID=159447 RepID=UPI0025E9E72B|nr:threonine/serine exporter family protein [uncultured Corynebacterium sp.]
MDSPTPSALTTTRIRDRLGFLADLGCGFLESGQTGSRTGETLRRDAAALGLEGFNFTTVGRVVIVEAHLPDGGNVTVTTAAEALDLIDCTRSRRLYQLAESIAEDTAETAAPGGCAAPVTDLDDLRDHVRNLRASATPWWAVTIGTTLLAFVIAMQVGVAWQAWVTASVVQVVTAVAGQLLGRYNMPQVFTIAAQSTIAGAAATALVKLDIVDPVGAAAAIAVNWLLLIPLPQIIGAMNDIIESDYLSAVTRAGSVAVTGLGITVGGALTFTLGEILHMEHPLLEELPGLPWYLALVFSALGAVGNALANGGWLRLVIPAALIGLITGGVNQLLLTGFGLDILWGNSVAAIVLGAVSVVMASRTGYPQHVFALMGITGALLPGISVVSGILLQMGGASGTAQFLTAATICVALGTGSAFGAFVVERARGASLRRR